MTYMLPESEILKKRFYAQRAIQHRVDIDRLWKLFPLLPQEIGRPTGDGVLPEDESSSSSSSSSSSKLTCKCSSATQFTFTIAGVTNGAMSCCSTKVNRTWTLSNPGLGGCSWQETISASPCAINPPGVPVPTIIATLNIGVSNVQLSLAGGSNGIVVYTVSRSTFDCNGSTNMPRTSVGGACVNMPTSITVSKV